MPEVVVVAVAEYAGGGSSAEAMENSMGVRALYLPRILAMCFPSINIGDIALQLFTALEAL